MEAPRPHRLAATALALALLPVLCSCSSLQLAFGSTSSGAFSTLADFRADDSVPAPDWVPTDAADIRYTTDARDRASILMFRSPTHFAPGACDLLSETSAATTAEQASPLEDSWWPDALPASLFSCGDGWTAFTDGDTVYAFDAGVGDTSSGMAAG